MSKSHDVSRSAATTLSAVDEALRRADDLHWSDPAFLKWEAGHVGELVVIEEDAPDPRTRYWADSGPAHDRADRFDLGVEEAPMISRRWDHPPSCLCDEGEVPPGRAMIVRAAEYPPPEHTTRSGPLLLGPEPDGQGVIQ